MKLEITKDKGTSLITSIVVFILGALLFSKPDEVVKVISYVFGALFAIYGFYSIYKYVKEKYNPNLITGVVCILIALVFIFLASVIEAALRYLIGAWILFAGITRLIYALSYIDRKENRFVSSLIIAILLIILGFYMLFKRKMPKFNNPRLIGLYLIFIVLLIFIFDITF